MDLSFFNRWAVAFMRLLQSDFALSVEDAAAIVGNAGHESNGFQSLQELKPLVPGSRGGFGIMQWTGPRRREFEAYCARNHLTPADMNTNYKYLFVELSGPEGKVLPKLKAAPTLAAKVEVFCNGFLRPGIPHMESRQTWARCAMSAWAAQSPVAAPIPAPTPAENNPIIDKRLDRWNEGTSPTPASQPPATPEAPQAGFWAALLDVLRRLFKVQP